jgi:catalase
MPLSGEAADRYDRNEGNDDYTQPGDLYRKVMNDEERQRLIDNIVGHMSQITSPKRDEIINRQLCHFFRADPEYGQRVADGLGVDVNKIMESAQFQHA